MSQPRIPPVYCPPISICPACRRFRQCCQPERAPKIHLRMQNATGLARQFRWTRAVSYCPLTWWRHRTGQIAVLEGLVDVRSVQKPPWRPDHGMSASPPESGHCKRTPTCRPSANSRHHTKEPPPIREAAFASLKAPLRPVRAPVDPTDASEGREASGRRRTLPYDSRKTNARPARSS